MSEHFNLVCDTRYLNGGFSGSCVLFSYDTYEEAEVAKQTTLQENDRHIYNLEIERVFTGLDSGRVLIYTTEHLE